MKNKHELPNVYVSTKPGAVHGSTTTALASVARKLCRRAHHLLRELGDDALAPTDPSRAKLVDAAA